MKKQNFKKLISMILSTAILFSFSACKVRQQETSNTEAFKATYKVISGGETTSLILAGENRADLISLTLNPDIKITFKNQVQKTIKNGDTLEIIYNGTMLESYPGRLGGVKSINVLEPIQGTAFDISSLYLEVLSDLLEADSALNDGIEYISIDLETAPGLTEGEKSAIAYVFGNLHPDTTILEMSYDELKENGYLTPCQDELQEQDKDTVYQFENGVLLSITPSELDENEAYSLPLVKFNAKKWRSPLGAYYFDNCTALWSENGSRDGYKIGSEAIS